MDTKHILLLCRWRCVLVRTVSFFFAEEEWDGAGQGLNHVQYVLID